jgi:KipI family sensor histidine kinase inhibitor
MKAKTKSNRGYELGYPRLSPLGDSAVIMQLGSQIDPQLNQQVLSLEQSLLKAGILGITATVPAYASLTLHYDPTQTDFHSIQDEILLRLASLEEVTPVQGKVVDVPVIYDGEHGPDLEFVAQYCHLTSEEVVNRHSAFEYRVHFIGFLPGFPYLGGMDAALTTPRLPSPRMLVKAGSVGIAGAQTGIYPLDSPGGWCIIGWTPLKLFDSFQNPPALLSPGDRVRFIPISAKDISDA